MVFFSRRRCLCEGLGLLLLELPGFPDSRCSRKRPCLYRFVLRPVRSRGGLRPSPLTVALLHISHFARRVIPASAPPRLLSLSPRPVKVMEGMETLEQINSQFCDDNGRPYRDIRILHTYVLDDPFDDPPQVKRHTPTCGGLLV